MLEIIFLQKEVKPLHKKTLVIADKRLTNYQHTNLTPQFWPPHRTKVMFVGSKYSTLQTDHNKPQTAEKEGRKVHSSNTHIATKNCIM